MSDSHANRKSSPKDPSSIIYECTNCGTKQSLEELSRLPELKCIVCGHRILKKVRAPIAKRIQHAD